VVIPPGKRFMARKLTPTRLHGAFFDQAIATPSMNAGLPAWHPDSLVDQGAAREATIRTSIPGNANPSHAARMIACFANFAIASSGDVPRRINRPKPSTS
jgi:hypothetical protein